jgi:hypothetical protein
MQTHERRKERSAGKRRKPEAVRALAEAAAQRSAWMVYLRIEPVFDVIRPRQEFGDLVRQVNIPEIP